MGKTQQQSLTLIPASLYFKDGRAKVQLALAKGRRLYDKRNVLKARDAERGGRPGGQGGQPLGRTRASSAAVERRGISPYNGEAGQMVGIPDTGVIGFDFGRQGRRSEPWSPEPR